MSKKKKLYKVYIKGEKDHLYTQRSFRNFPIEPQVGDLLWQDAIRLEIFEREFIYDFKSKWVIKLICVPYNTENDE